MIDIIDVAVYACTGIYMYEFIYNNSDLCAKMDTQESVHNVCALFNPPVLLQKNCNRGVC